MIQNKIAVGMAIVYLGFSRHLSFSIWNSINMKFSGFLYCIYRHPTAHFEYSIFWALICQKTSDPWYIWWLSDGSEFNVFIQAWPCQTHWVCKIIYSLQRHIISSITEVCQPWGVCIHHLRNSRPDASEILRCTMRVHCTFTCVSA